MVRSLKDKRNIIKSLQDQLQNKFNLAVAELDNNELWKQTVLGIVTISNDRRYLESLTDKVIELIDEYHEVEIIDYAIEYY